LEIHGLKQGLGFSEIWRELKDCYRTLAIRCIAVEEDETLKNIMTVAFLTNRKRDDVQFEVKHDYHTLEKIGIPKVKGLRLLYDVKGSLETPSFIEEIKGGHVNIAGETVELSRGYEKTSVVGHSRVSGYPETDMYPTLIYECSGEASGNKKKVSKISENLKEVGVLSGIDDVGLRWLKVPYITSHCINVIVNFPLYVKIASLPSLKDREFKISLRVHQKLQEKFQFTISLLRKEFYIETTLESDRYSLSKLQEIKKEQDYIILQLIHRFSVLPNPEDLIFYALSGRLGIIYRQKLLVKDLLPKRYQESLLNAFLFFMEIDKFTRILTGEEKVKKKKKPLKEPAMIFQRMVAWLLSLLGFRVLEIGDTAFGVIKTKDEVAITDIDILAEDPEESKIYAMFCSVTSVEDKKIDAIMNAVDELRRNNVHIVPLVVVRSKAPALKQKLEKYGIKGIDRDDLLKVIELLRNGNIPEARRKIVG